MSRTDPVLDLSKDRRTQDQGAAGRDLRVIQRVGVKGKLGEFGVNSCQ